MPSFKFKPAITSVGENLSHSLINFLHDRGNDARELYMSLLPAREQDEANSGTQLENSPSSLEAPTKEMATVESAGELAPEEGLMPDEAFCAMLNRRLETVRQQEGFEELECYMNECDYYHRECFRLPMAKIQHNRRQALRYVTRMEFFAKMYRTYRRDFDNLKSQVEEIECLLSTDNAFYAEIEMPMDEAFAPGEEATRILRFSYSAQGVAAAKRWIKTTTDIYYGSKDKNIRKPSSTKR